MDLLCLYLDLNELLDELGPKAIVLCMQELNYLGDSMGFTLLLRVKFPCEIVFGGSGSGMFAMAKRYFSSRVKLLVKLKSPATDPSIPNILITVFKFGNF